MGNIAALIYHSFRSEFGDMSVNWSGFYLVRKYLVQGAAAASDDAEPTRALILGPFHGKPAVSVIAYGKGVCGESWKTNSSQFVPDVHLHPNHIACDSASESEIVIPLRAEDGSCIGLLDMDSPSKNGFTQEDLKQMEDLVTLLQESCDFTHYDHTASVVAESPEDAVCSLKRHAHR